MESEKNIACFIQFTKITTSCVTGDMPLTAVGTFDRSFLIYQHSVDENKIEMLRIFSI